MLLMRRKRFFILSLLILLFIVTIEWKYLLFPTVREYMVQRRALHELTLLQSNRKWYENYLVLKEEKDEKANYLSGLESDLLYEDELHRFIGTVHQLSLAVQSDLVRFQPGPVISSEPYLTQNAQIFIKGSFAQIVDFLKRFLELRVYQKLNFSILPYEDKLQCMINLHLYYLAGKRGG